MSFSGVEVYSLNAMFSLFTFGLGVGPFSELHLKLGNAKGFPRPPPIICFVSLFRISSFGV